MQATKLTYMEDQNLFESTSKILDIIPTEDGRISIILDQTIFYPQGGGQPYDKGTISNGEAIFEVQEVRFADEVVSHIGKYIDKELKIGDEVTCAVDSKRRLFNSREHSAGHLISYMMELLPYNLKPAKGHHFPGECYVACEGEIPEMEREKFKIEIEKMVNDAIALKIPVEVKIVEYSELEELCDLIPLYVPQNKPCRIMRIMFDEKTTGNLPKKPVTMPCGGTHVNNLSDIKEVQITKCGTKKGMTKLSYGCI